MEDLIWRISFETAATKRKPYTIQKEPAEVFYKKRCSAKRLQHRCFPVSIAKFLTKLILKNICERLLLTIMDAKFSGITSLIKAKTCALFLLCMGFVGLSVK